MKEKKKYQDKDAFKVPENYFEDFTDKMMLGINKSQAKVGRKYFDLIRPHIMLAASMVIIVVVSYTALKLLLPDYSDKDNNETSGDLIEYLAYELDQSSLLESFYTGEKKILTDFVQTDDISNDEIVDYLISVDFNFYDLNDN